MLKEYVINLKRKLKCKTGRIVVWPEVLKETKRWNPLQKKKKKLEESVTKVELQNDWPKSLKDEEEEERESERGERGRTVTTLIINEREIERGAYLLLKSLIF